MSPRNISTLGMSTVQLILWNCEIAKSIQFTIGISNVQLILRNYEIVKSVQFAKTTLHSPVIVS